jgi:5'-nucleotidase
VGWRASGAPGSRVASTRRDGVPIDPGERYRVTVNVFLGDGGDGYGGCLAGTERLGGPLDVDALASWLGEWPVTPIPQVPRVHQLAD